MFSHLSNAAMIAGTKGRAHLAAMPRERVLPETDGPFAQRHGRPLMPWEAAGIATYLGEVGGPSETQINEMFRANLSRLTQPTPSSPVNVRSLDV